jgi:hypothetical protein
MFDKQEEVISPGLLEIVNCNVMRLTRNTPTIWFNLVILFYFILQLLHCYKNIVDKFF